MQMCWAFVPIIYTKRFQLLASFKKLDPFPRKEEIQFILQYQEHEAFYLL